MRRPLPLAFLTLALLATLELVGLRWTASLENRFVDTLVRWQAARLAPDDEIVVIDIDESSLARMQDEAGSWPWPRAVYAELLLGLAAQRPRAIVFDLLFAEADTFRPESDAAFVAAFDGLARVYVPMLRLDPDDDARGLLLREVAPLIGARATAEADPQARAMLLLPTVLPERYWRTGLINFSEDADGVGRRYPLWTEVGGWRLPSLPARIAADLGYAVPERDDLLLHWRGAAGGGYTQIAFADLYFDFQRRERQRAPDEFRDRIVVIGTAASGLRDLRVTPLNSLYPGVEILATALDNLKNQRSMHEAAPWLGAVFALTLLLALWLAFERRWHPWVIGSALLTVTALSLLAAYAALHAYWRIAVLVPLAFAWAGYWAGALFEYLRERRTRENAVRLFGRFLDPQVVNRLVERGETVESLSGREHQISVLFSDIRGFTSLSERQTPQQVVALLNAYFSRQVAVVFRHGGTLDKFIGDCIMAFWGAPLADPRHAQRAVACALEMQRVLAEFKSEMRAAGDEFDVGIGIHSGSAVVGFIGAEQKLDYTAIGDTVNLASRIEGLTKGVARILVSADTVAACGEAYRYTPRGSFNVKGRAQTVELYEPEDL